MRDSVGDTRVTVLCSTEQKAIDTAKALGLGEVDTDERLCEVSRPWYEDEPSFREAVERFLTGSPASGWEPADQAVGRFGAALNDLDGTGVVVTHGTVMSAWLGHEVTGLDPVRFWVALRMPDAWLVDPSAQFATRIADGTAP